MTVVLFALAFALAFSRFSIIPGEKQVIAVPQGGAVPPENDTPIAAEDDVSTLPEVRDDNEFQEPLSEPDNTADTTAPEPEAEVEQPVEAVADAGLVDFEDEFGQSHKVTPHTAAYMKYAQEQIARSRQQQQFTPPPPQTPAQQATQTLQPPDNDASEGEWQAYFRSMQNDMGAVRQQISELANIQKETRLASHRQSLHEAGMNRLESILTENPYLKANPRVAAAVKEDISGQLKVALRNINEHTDAASVASAVYADSLTLTQKYARLVGGQAVKNAEARKEAAKKSAPPAGGHAPVASKGTRPANETPAQLNARMQKFAQKVFSKS